MIEAVPQPSRVLTNLEIWGEPMPDEKTAAVARHKDLAELHELSSRGRLLSQNAVKVLIEELAVKRIRVAELEAKYETPAPAADTEGTGA